MFGTLAAPMGLNDYEPQVYPAQQDAVGAAQLTRTDEGGKVTYTFKNNLFEAYFIEQGGHIMFGGCPAMNLKADSEIFTIKFGNGSTVVNASQMTLGAVTTGDLDWSADAIKGAEHFPGKYLQAVFTHQQGDALVTFTWRAELRDGSHYLRTDLTMKSDHDVKFNAIIPMQYTVDAVAAGSAPAVSGNTRGSLLISDKIFAGLETPTGYNTAGTEDDLDGAFAYGAWDGEAYFNWVPSELPAGITDTHYTVSNTVGKRGYLKFKESGQQTITFTYKSGAHKLNIAGVDLVDPETGLVVAHDYHNGRTGGSHALNTYTLDVPETKVYMVRYFISLLAWSENYASESISSKGDITYSKPVKTVTVVHDLPATQSARATTIRRQAQATTDGDRVVFNDEDTYNITYTTVNSTNWTALANADVPRRVQELGYYDRIFYKAVPIRITEEGGKMKLTFKYTSGSHRIDVVGVDVIDAQGNIASDDYHFGYAGSSLVDNVYAIANMSAGDYTLRLLVTTANGNTATNGSVDFAYAIETFLHLPAAAEVPIQGLWSRDTNLLAYNAENVVKDMEWNVSAVVGLVNPSHKRRSVLAYSERERAVPWRPFPIYNSWYELNIDRNNHEDPTQNVTVEQCTAVVNAWKQKLYDVYHVGLKSFLWDDGWDEYGTWNHHAAFPNGFKECGQAAAAMNSGTGAWLGPVGGYGTSGGFRRNYWNGKGGMVLSNVDYYNVFKNSCVRLVQTEPERDHYEFNYFKFDGISGQFSSVGPDPGSAGNENAEGIITCERYVRENVKSDIFFNTTVGTWASPFWFHFSDAVWRQEKDYGEIGVGNSREKWITYRDRLVYQNFVQNAPYCPINSMMTHGFILHRGNGVSSTFDYAGVLRELRCAFACGSGQVELYADHAVLDEIESGKLWKDIADCINWQEANKDVLPDIHWVGGNPWTGSKAEIYGWASWNGKKGTLTLRNGATAQQIYKTTLREVLDIPVSYTGKVSLKAAFEDQLGKLAEIATINGQAISDEEELDVTAEITFTLPASTVYVFGALNPDAEVDPTPEPEPEDAAYKIIRHANPAQATKHLNVATNGTAINISATTDFRSLWTLVETATEGQYKFYNEYTGKYLANTGHAALCTMTDDAEQAAVVAVAAYTPATSQPTAGLANVVSLTNTATSKYLFNNAEANTNAYFGYGSSSPSNSWGCQFIIEDYNPADVKNWAQNLLNTVQDGYVGSRENNDDMKALQAAVDANEQITPSLYRAAEEAPVLTLTEGKTYAIVNNVNPKIAIYQNQENGYKFSYGPYVEGDERFIFRFTEKGTETSSNWTANQVCDTYKIACVGATTDNSYVKTGTWNSQITSATADEAQAYKVVEVEPCVFQISAKYSDNCTFSTSGSNATTLADNASGNLVSWNIYNNRNLTNHWRIREVEAPAFRGRFVRIKGYSGNYISMPTASTNAKMSDATDKTTILYCTEKGELINYGTGLGLRETSQVAPADAALDGHYLKPGAQTGRYNIVSNSSGSKFLYDNTANGTKLDRNSGAVTNGLYQTDWTIEPVDALPVTFGEYQYNTLYTPVALSVPAGARAYVCRISSAVDAQSNGTIHLFNVVADESGAPVIPAGTGVLLYAPDAAANTTFQFPLNGYDDTYEDNGFEGILRTQTAEENHVWYSLQGKIENEAKIVGFFLKTSTTPLAGFHAYVKQPATSSVRAYLFEMGEGETEGVATQTLLQQLNASTYDLSGRRVNRTPARGLYITDGKKVVKSF